MQNEAEAAGNTSDEPPTTPHDAPSRGQDQESSVPTQMPTQMDNTIQIKVQVNFSDGEVLMFQAPLYQHTLIKDISNLTLCEHRHFEELGTISVVSREFLLGPPISMMCYIMHADLRYVDPEIEVFRFVLMTHPRQAGTLISPSRRLTYTVPLEGSAENKAGMRAVIEAALARGGGCTC